MIQKQFTYFLLGSLLILMGCQKENMGDCFKSTGKNSSERRSVAPFNTVEMEDKIEVNYYESQSYYVEVSGGKNLLEFIETKSQGGVLSIKNNNRCNWVRSFDRKIKVDIYAPGLRALNVRGVGNFNTIDSLTADTFLLNSYGGSGTINLLTNCNYIELKSHTGPADIIAKGQCRELVAYLKGIGNLNAIRLRSEEGLIINESTGELQANVSRLMKVELRNYGNILYQGNPIIELSDTGDGKLIKLD